MANTTVGDLAKHIAAQVYEKPYDEQTLPKLIEDAIVSFRAEKSHAFISFGEPKPRSDGFAQGDPAQWKKA